MSDKQIGVTKTCRTENMAASFICKVVGVAPVYELLNCGEYIPATALVKSQVRDDTTKPLAVAHGSLHIHR